MGELNQQNLANTAWAFAKAGHLDEMLFAAWRMGGCNSQELAKTAWVFAKVGHLDEKPFAVSARAAERHMGEFNPQSLANAA